MRRLETSFFPLFYLTCRIRFRRFSADRVKRYQLRRMREVVRFAAKKSKFFKSHYKSFDLDDLFRLPLVNKSLMMDNLTDYNTVSLTHDEVMAFCLEVEEKKDYTRRLKGMNVGMSSGTSGNKGVEILSRYEENYLKGAFFARFVFPKKAKINLAFILRVSTPAFNLDKFGHKLSYISQLEVLDEMIRQLEKLQPNLVSAPPSMLEILARSAESGNLSIRPQRLISYAEVLYPEVKDYLVKTFNCEVHEIYKCTEGAIGMTCKHGSLHINEDLVLIETLNADGSVTAPGEPCQKLLITDLHKRSQPIIRYELNDIITISKEACSCGSSFRVIESIHGRADDLFWANNLKSGGSQYIFPDYIRRAIITASDDIDEYQAIQKADDKVLVRLQLKSGANHNLFSTEIVKENIRNVFA
ncbi:MAG: AMP-binding protein, partial [Bacteroidetes bacterium]|nr:AMP-binding protein [Bacteroidota bacterium]